MKHLEKITPCLWFDDQAETAANFYVSVFPNSKIQAISRFSGAGQEIHGRPEGSVMTVAFELDGQPFTALNGGPFFKFNEALSLQVGCDTQEEIDRYWRLLGEGGDPAAQQCGWLKDRYGLSWQIVPRVLIAMITDPDRAKAMRATNAMLQMKKFDLSSLKLAFERSNP
jgi:predicted 3-demethylubiquinone-9 3-methyltransferase (glyoxalase superfamily)